MQPTLKANYLSPICTRIPHCVIFATCSIQYSASYHILASWLFL